MRYTAMPMNAITKVAPLPQHLETPSLEELRVHGLSRVAYPDTLKELVERAVSSWRDFCALPKTEKEVFAFLEDTHGDGCGYELKETKAEKRDLKENFHVTLHQHQRLEALAKGGSFLFLSDARNLLDQIEPLVLGYAANLEREFHLEGFAEEVKASKPYWTLRYLHYFGNQAEGTQIALPHADKGGFTLHLYESHPGLQYYRLDQPLWEDAPMGEKQTVIFPSMQLQLLTQGALKALYHRVLATDQTAHTGRFSMVCFITFENVPKYRKKDLGSMQTHATAFNYAMPHADFEKLFS